MPKDKSVLYSHKTDEHITPPQIIERLYQTFNIQYDPCPSPHYLHPCFLKREPLESYDRDYVLKYWPDVPTFVNPPYSDLDAWVDVCLHVFKNRPHNPIIMLLPSRSDRPWFERVLRQAHAIGFKRKRFRFWKINEDTRELEPAKWVAPFPSVFFILESNVSVERNAEILQCLQDLDCVSLILQPSAPPLPYFTFLDKSLKDESSPLLGGHKHTDGYRA